MEEEKNRFEYYQTQNQFYDKINDELYCLEMEQDKDRLLWLLNQMSEDLKTLYKRNQKLKEESYPAYQREHKRRAYLENIEIPKLKEENRQLKQSQKQLTISELEKVKDILWASQDIGNLIDNDIFLGELNNQIKSLKGEE